MKTPLNLHRKAAGRILFGLALTQSGVLAQPTGTPAEVNRLVINADLGKETISRNIYGHFAEHLGGCIYGGFWVGEESPIPNVRGIRSDVVEALKKIRVPVLRWPGGCFADEYHWKDGVGPRDRRPKMVNTHWGQVTETNQFGTHEFLDLCEQLDCEPYIAGNVGSGTVEEMQDWVEYITFGGESEMADLRRGNGQQDPWSLTYFGVGNENWGCGGRMSPGYYVDLYRRYRTYLRNFGDNQLYAIACGASGDDYSWTDVLMKAAFRPDDYARPMRMDGLSLHYYCGSGRESRSATRFTEVDWFHLLKSALRIEEILQGHITLMDRYDPEGKVALIVDEWGTWHNVEPGTNPRFLYQQNTLRDAMVAAITLNAFNQNCGRVKMANIAQTVNVLQAMILTDGRRITVTPTYHVFEMYRVHQDAQLLPVSLRSERYTYETESIPMLSVSASRDASGRIHLSVCNLDPQRPAPLECEIRGASASAVSGRILTAPEMNAHNTFDQPANVQPAVFEGARLEGETVLMDLPAKSIVVLELN